MPGSTGPLTLLACAGACAALMMGPAVAACGDDSIASVAAVDPPKPQRTRPFVAGGFRPDQVIGNLACRFRAGQGNAAGTAIVVLPSGRSARFEVLDGKGRVFGGALPFRPNHYRLARHEDGAILAGFADLRLNSLVRRDRDTPEPVRIFRDGRVIYQAEKVWDFGLAPDGSAFFAIVPAADHTSRLVIHNLDQGIVHEHDLGFEYTSAFDDLPYIVHFSTTGTEVLLSPWEFGAGDTYFFFPIDGGSARKLPAEGLGYPVFESSDLGYFPSWPGDSRLTVIQKKKLHWNASNDKAEFADVWTRPIDLEHFFGTMSLSNDGRWLLLNAWSIHVLDTAAGEPVFEFPIAAALRPRAIRTTFDSAGAGTQQSAMSGRQAAPASLTAGY